MRVALVAPYSWTSPGGVRSHVTGLAQALRADGHEVEVIAPADGEVDFPGLRAVGRSVPIRDNGSIVPVALSPAAAARTARLVRKGGFDLVHVHEPMIPAVSLTATLAATVPCVGTFHMYAAGRRWYRPFAPLCRHAVGRLAARIAVSEAARWHVARTCPGEYHVIPNGVDVGAYALPARRTGSRLLFVGRAERRKGLPVLLEAFARLPADATLDLAGVTEAQAARLGARLPATVRARIRAHGWVSDTARVELLAEADVLCVPSRQGESFGIVLVEGMAAGVPVVASHVAGYVEVLPRTCGRLVPPGDPEALAAALAELLADPALRAELGAAGREAAKRYDWPVVYEQTLAVYQEALEKGPSAGAGGRVARHSPSEPRDRILH